MLTPVDFREGMYWKRDDLYKPFGDYHVNGGKVRQALQLFETKIDEIKNEHNNGVITAASVHVDYEDRGPPLPVFHNLLWFFLIEY